MAIVLVLIPVKVATEPFAVPDTTGCEKFLYKSRVIQSRTEYGIKASALAQRAIRGELPRRVLVQIERKAIGDKRFIIYRRVERLTNGNVAHWIFVFDATDKLIMLSMKKRVTTSDGKAIRNETVNFRVPVLGYPPDLMMIFVLDFSFRSVRFKKGTRKVFPLYLTSINIINMDVSVVGKETVVVPAGRFRCWRVEMRPHLEDWVGKVVANILKPFTPDYVYWFNTGNRHMMVKYKGTLGAIGAPVQVMELARAKTEGANCAMSVP